MPYLQPSPIHARRLRHLAVYFGALMLCLLVLTGVADAQSGRRAPRNISPVPTPEPAASPKAAPEARSKTDNKTLYSFILYGGENGYTNLPLGAATAVNRGFMERMRQSSSVSIKDAGRGNRSRAREDAKKQTESFVIVLELDENQMMSRTPGRVDASSISVRYSVYAPQTATLKLNGSVYLRPVTRTARVGGLPIPVPAPTGGLSYEYVLEQAGRDAADRVFSGLHISLPER